MRNTFDDDGIAGLVHPGLVHLDGAEEEHDTGGNGLGLVHSAQQPTMIGVSFAFRDYGYLFLNDTRQQCSTWKHVRVRRYVQSDVTTGMGDRWAVDNYLRSTPASNSCARCRRRPPAF